MTSPEVLEKHGISAEQWKSKFTSNSPSDKIKDLIQRHSYWITGGLERVMDLAPQWSAIDHMLTSAQRSLPYVQARELAERGGTEEQIAARFNTMGLNRMLEPMLDPMTGKALLGDGGMPKLCFNQPIFERVYVPLVASYRNIRLAKLFTDRNLYPRYKYAPARQTARDMLVAEIITARIERMNGEMGYAEIDRQSIQAMLDYGFAFNLPQEHYYREEFIAEEGGKEVTKVNREGVRFTVPHPKNVIFDETQPLSTLNSDTGIRWMGYWDVLPYSQLQKNDKFWNVDKVSYGGYPFMINPKWRIYQMLYPCRFTFPSGCDTISPQANNRLDSAFFYSSADKDAAVTIEVIFHKLVPKDYGLGDYDFPIWTRFVYGDTGTVLYAEPICYTPGCVWLYNYDPSKTLQSSLAMELTPFQQMIGNFLTQHYLSVKQNLLRIAWINTDIVPKEHVTMIAAMKEKVFMGLRLMGFSKRADQVVTQDRRDAVLPMQFGQVDLTGLSQNLSLTMMVVERMLGYSAQEVGAPAAHQQTAREVEIIAGNSTVRIDYVQACIDETLNAKKRMLYEAMVAYSSDVVFAEVSDMDNADRKKALEKMNFKIEEGADPTDKDKHGVTGSKKSLTLESFLTSREGTNRLSDTKLGIAMMQALSVALQNPAILQAVGADQLVKLLNYVFVVAGLPPDFRLKPLDSKSIPGAVGGADPGAPAGPPADPAKQAEEMQQQMLAALDKAKQEIIAEAVQVTADGVKKNVIEPVTQELQGAAQQIQGLAAQQQEMGQAIQFIAQIMQRMGVLPAPGGQPPGPMPPGPPQPMPPNVAPVPAGPTSFPA